MYIPEDPLAFSCTLQSFHQASLCGFSTPEGPDTKYYHRTLCHWAKLDNDDQRAELQKSVNSLGNCKDLLHDDVSSQNLYFHILYIYFTRKYFH